MDPIQTQNPEQNVANPVPQADAIWGQNPYNLVGDGATTPMGDIAQAVPATTVQPATPAPASTGGWKFMKWLIRMIAKLSGQPDPLTGEQEKKPTPEGQPAPAKWLMGQIGGAFSGIAQTAQQMAGEAVAWVKEATKQAIPTVPNTAPAQPTTPVPEVKVEPVPTVETPVSETTTIPPTQG